MRRALRPGTLNVSGLLFGDGVWYGGSMRDQSTNQRAKRPRVEQMTFCLSFAPVMLPQGDGSVLVKPGRPVSRLTARETAVRMRCSVWTVYDLFHRGILTGERPSERKILIDSESLERHLEASRDPEFWDRVNNSRNS